MRYGIARLKEFTYRPPPPVELLVSGPPSSGTRLITRLLAESGHSVKHDTSHGGRGPGALQVVTTSRDRAAHVASIVRRGMAEDADAAEARIDVAVDRIADRYPDVPCVSFEELIEDRDAELDRVAVLLGWDSWVSTIEVRDENRKHLT